MYLRSATFLYFFIFVFYSSYSQVLRGRVYGLETKDLIEGAGIEIASNQVTFSNYSDSSGSFRFINIPIGRYLISVKKEGYSFEEIKDILVVSGKETILEVMLNKKNVTLREIKVTSSNTSQKLSSKTINIEQTTRYAATWGDPARMAMSFAGVNQANDQSNELVIRGNSPKGLLWRIEGVEVPSPNHFSAEGASGGNISALHPAVLKNSTFLTGAFPAEYGNALSGVFDVKLREGNAEKREHHFTAGLTGVELGTEGPIYSKGKNSYLMAYRWSDFTLAKSLGASRVLSVSTPKFQDFTGKLHFDLGRFKLGAWGIYGKNISDFEFQQYLQVDVNSNFYASGINANIVLNNRAFLENIVSFSGYRYVNTRNELFQSGQKQGEQADFSYNNIRLSSIYNKSLRNFGIFQIGSIFSNLEYNLYGNYNFYFPSIDLSSSDSTLKDRGNSFAWQNFIQADFSRSKFKMTFGLHSVYFLLNKEVTLEPRISASLKIIPSLSLSFATGLHSRLEPISIYLFKNNQFNGHTEPIDNTKLKIQKSWHHVFGASYKLNDRWRLSTEFYYQNLFHVGIGDVDQNLGIGDYSLINERNAVSQYPLKSEGKGKNYGIELTAERSLNRGIYFLGTASVFRSFYTMGDKEYLPSRYDNRFVYNTLAGKEWQLGNNLLNLNLRFTYSGGIRIRPYEMRNGVPVTDYSEGYSTHLANYFRTDFKVNYILNWGKTTSTFSVDINNITNRKNPLTQLYNPILKNMETVYQLGLLPVLSYRIDF